MISHSTEENMLKDLVLFPPKFDPEKSPRGSITGADKEIISPRNSIHQEPTTPKKPQKKHLRRLIYLIVEAGWAPWDFIFSSFIFFLIVESIIIFVISTVPGLPREVIITFQVLDAVNIVVFMIEYILRVYVSIERKSLRPYGPIWGRLMYCVRLLSLLDLLSIISYLAFLIWEFSGPSPQPHVYGMLRLFRVLLLIRAEKHLQSLKTILTIIRDQRDVVLSGTFVSVTIWIISSCLLYYTEREYNPESFPDILASMMITLKIVTAYGVPIDDLTLLGRILVAGNCFLAIYIFGLPAVAILYGYDEASEKVRNEFMRTFAGSESDSDDEPIQEEANEFPFKNIKQLTRPNWCTRCSHCIQKLELLENMEKIRMRKLIKMKKDEEKKKQEWFKKKSAESSLRKKMEAQQNVNTNVVAQGEHPKVPTIPNLNIVAVPTREPTKPVETLLEEVIMI